MVKHDQNLSSIEIAIDRQENVIEQEETMIRIINRPENTANENLIQIDTGRLRDNIDGHRQEIALFKNEVKEEEARRKDTERMILYLEVKDET